MASLQGTKDTFLRSCPFLNTWSVPNRQKCAHNANKQAKAGYRIKHPMIIGQGSYKNPYSESDCQGVRPHLPNPCSTPGLRIKARDCLERSANAVCKSMGGASM